MKKDDVEFHSDGCCRRAHPAINVKCYHFGGGLTAETLECDDDDFDRAMQFAFDTQARQFWESAKERAKEIFGADIEVYSEGRSSGWLVVHGLPLIEEWDAVMLAKWGSLAAFCRKKIQYLSSAEAVKDIITTNRWNEPGSEEYNFVTRGGEDICLVDLKTAAVAAGFGPVVRTYRVSEVFEECEEPPDTGTATT